MAKKYIKNFCVRCLFCIIIFLIISIFCNFSDKNFLWFKNNIFDKNISFSFFNNIYNKYLNKYIPFDIGEEKIVMGEELIYDSKKDFQNGVSLSVGKNYNMHSLCGGIVVYIGEKENLGKTVIIQGTDGVDYWYSNLDNLSVKLYDYIEKNTLLGVSISDNIYLTFVKDGNYINYEKFI